jgi:hypothetical protein
MPGRSTLYRILGVVAVAASRILFRSHFLYDVDSVNFALAMRRFDPAVHQPHPPGYFLYVCLGRLVNLLIPDANAALVAISVAASCGAVWMIHLLTEEWFGERPALIALVLFLVSPLCWFHGIVALTYIVEAFFSALVGYLCWKVYTGNHAFLIPASVAFALAAGFRPSSALFLAPLWLLSVWRMDWRRRWLALLAAGAATLAWFLPMTAAAGGIGQYFASLSHLWLTVPGRRTTLSSPALAVARGFTIAWVFVLCFGAASAFLFQSTHKLFSPSRDRRTFTWVWIAPGLLFFTFVFFNYINSGYVLLLSPPVFAWLSARIDAFLRAEGHPLLRRAALAAGVAVNCVVFVWAPFYCSYRSVRNFERSLTAVTGDFREHLDPANTMIMGFDSHFLGYRHAGYYLPEFVTVEYPELSYNDGRRVFWMYGGDTQAVRSFGTGGFDRFAIFPLPDGGEYSDYLKKVQAKLPAGVLNTVLIGKSKVLMGPVSALPPLFPATATPQRHNLVRPPARPAANPRGGLCEHRGSPPSAQKVPRTRTNCKRSITTGLLPVYWRSHPGAAMDASSMKMNVPERVPRKSRLGSKLP